MSNIGKTSAAIKKKLSLADYRTPVRKRASKKVRKPASKPACKQAAKKISQKAIKPVAQHAVQPEKHGVDIPAMQLASTPVNIQVSMPVQPEKSTKTKATYYLGARELEMLTHLYIKQLQQHNKADRSALVCEAIRLLHARDMER